MLLTEYEFAQPPVNVPFDEMPRAQARQHFNWFVTQIPERLDVLSRTLSANGGETVCLDFSPESLERLGSWFDKHIESRPMSQDELAQENAVLPEWFIKLGDREDWILTDETLSLCSDIGIYFGEVMRYQYPVLNWDYVKSGRKFIDYNRPVIAPIKGLIERMCPQQVVVRLAMKCAEGGNAQELMRMRWEYWSNLMLAPEVLPGS